MFVRRDGSFLAFCSRKCRRNLLKLGRSPRKLKWVTRQKRKAKGG